MEERVKHIMLEDNIIKQTLSGSKYLLSVLPSENKAIIISSIYYSIFITIIIYLLLLLSNNSQRREMNESCVNDYHQSSVKRLQAGTSCFQDQCKTDCATTLSCRSCSSKIRRPV